MVDFLDSPLPAPRGRIVVLVPVDIVPEVHHERRESGEVRDNLGHVQSMHAHLNPPKLYASERVDPLYCH